MQLTKPFFRPLVEILPPPPRPWVPSSRAMLCLEDGCEAVYPADGLPCPACGSNEAMPLARVTERKG